MSVVEEERRAVLQAAATLQQLVQVINSQGRSLTELASSIQRVTGSTSTSADRTMQQSLSVAATMVSAVGQRVRQASDQATDIARRL